MSDHSSPASSTSSVFSGSSTPHEEVAANRALIAEYLSRARAAQKIAATWSQERVDEVCVAVGWSVYNDENIRILAESAVAETGMGRVADKIAKHKNKVMGVLRDIRGVRTVGLMEIDQARGLRKYAKPVGVVGALVPVTNPTATPASNGLSILKGANAVIFAPHPKAKKSTTLACVYMREALKKVGAPVDLVQVIEEPSIELTQELMRQVDLIVATGGGAMVKAAYSSGKPAYGVGPGNAVQILCEDADADDAAQKSPPRRASTTRQAARARTRPLFTARSGIASSPDSLGRAGTSATRPRNAPCVTTSGSSVKTDRRTSTPPSSPKTPIQSRAAQASKSRRPPDSSS